MTAAGDIPDLLEVEVPVGGRVLVMADLHLTGDPAGADVSVSDGLASTIGSLAGPGVLVFAGNLFDTGARPAASLAAHPRLRDAIARFASGGGRHVVVLPGSRDAELAWSKVDQDAVAAALGASIALRADLHIGTGAGTQTVRVEPGQSFDPLSAPTDARNPLDTPVASHIRDQVLPRVRREGSPGGRAAKDRWLAGVEQLDDEGALARMVVSRLVYRRLTRWTWLLLVPLVVALILRLPETVLRSATHGALASRAGLFAAATVIELLLLILISVLAIRVTYRALGAISLADPGGDPNEGGRAAARDLVTAGYAGLVTGHSCRPELTHLGEGFYANAGVAAPVVSEYPGRLPGLGLPTVFLAHRTVSWLEIDAGNDLHVRLLHSRRELPGASVTERLMANRPPTAPAPSRRREAGEQAARVVATFPQGDSWPPPVSSERHHRRVRRAVAALLVVVGFASLVGSMSDPVNDRLNILPNLFPVSVPETAAAVSAFFGVALVVLARSIRRGQRRAWIVCEVLLLAVAVLHLIKGIDLGGVVAALAGAAVLYVYRSSFQARADVTAVPRGLANVAGAAVLTVLAGAFAIEVNIAFDRTRPHRNPIRGVSWAHAFEATLSRMAGFSEVWIPHRIDRFLSPALATAAAGLVLAAAWVLFRPVAARRRSHAATGAGGTDGIARARGIFTRHGSGTLDYFALRPDKQFFFWGDTVVAHAVYGGTCLVSPDPIGPVAEREEAWAAFRRYADGQGWALGGLGVGEEWLPIYRATGMHDLYAGDEAVVRVDRFTLEGGRFKGLRQAVNRIAKYGYTITFHDPATLEPGLRDQLQEVMTKSRRGDVERGFSMTLGRVFDPADTGLLLAVVHAPSGEPVAFCQYVPAPGIDGYSLDLMRRDDGDHPNGLIDFAVVETIKELKNRGLSGLGLNFATMRAVLAGEAGEGVSQRVQAWLLRRMGDSMQIESLWKFNAKFDPDWQPRYAVYDAPENMLAVGIAVARAESFWELPVIGRFLVPPPPEAVGADAAD